MNRRKYIITGLILLIIILGLFFVLTNTKTVVSVENPASDTLNVGLSTTTPNAATDTSEKISDTASSSQLQVSTSSASSTSSSTLASNTNATSTYYVSYTSAGFSPNALTIHIGETVVFTNNSSSSMWVASDPYPNNTNYPEFNQNKGTANGTSYQFTFERKGSFGFHDNLAPQLKGIIVVE